MNVEYVYAAKLVEAEAIVAKGGADIKNGLAFLLEAKQEYSEDPAATGGKNCAPFVSTVIRRLTEDPYMTLDLETTCAEADVKKAYRKLALKFHPDKNRATAVLFQVVQTAYDTLLDDEKRKAYDVRRQKQQEALQKLRKKDPATSAAPASGSSNSNSGGGSRPQSGTSNRAGNSQPQSAPQRQQSSSTSPPKRQESSTNASSNGASSSASSSAPAQQQQQQAKAGTKPAPAPTAARPHPQTADEKVHEFNKRFYEEFRRTGGPASRAGAAGGGGGGGAAGAAGGGKGKGGAGAGGGAGGFGCKNNAPPARPKARSTARTDSTVTLEWSCSCPSTTAFELQWKKRGRVASDWVTSPTLMVGNSCRKKNLEPCTCYEFRVRAASPWGWSAYSDPVMVVTLPNDSSTTSSSSGADANNTSSTNGNSSSSNSNGNQNVSDGTPGTGRTSRPGSASGYRPGSANSNASASSVDGSKRPRRNVSTFQTEGIGGGGGGGGSSSSGGGGGAGTSSSSSASADAARQQVHSARINREYARRGSKSGIGVPDPGGGGGGVKSPPVSAPHTARSAAGSEAGGGKGEEDDDDREQREAEKAAREAAAHVQKTNSWYWRRMSHAAAAQGGGSGASGGSGAGGAAGPAGAAKTTERRKTVSAQKPVEKGSWVCKVCKRMNEGGTTSCWVCYTAHDYEASNLDRIAKTEKGGSEEGSGGAQAGGTSGGGAGGSGAGGGAAAANGESSNSNGFGRRDSASQYRASVSKQFPDIVKDKGASPTSSAAGGGGGGPNEGASSPPPSSSQTSSPSSGRPPASANGNASKQGHLPTPSGAAAAAGGGAGGGGGTGSKATAVSNTSNSDGIRVTAKVPSIRITGENVGDGEDTGPPSIRVTAAESGTGADANGSSSGGGGGGGAAGQPGHQDGTAAPHNGSSVWEFTEDDVDVFSGDDYDSDEDDDEEGDARSCASENNATGAPAGRRRGSSGSGGSGKKGGGGGGGTSGDDISVRSAPDATTPVVQLKNRLNDKVTQLHNVRAEPIKEATVVGYLVVGKEIEIQTELGDWLRVMIHKPVEKGGALVPGWCLARSEESEFLLRGGGTPGSSGGILGGSRGSMKTKRRSTTTFADKHKLHIYSDDINAEFDTSNNNGQTDNNGGGANANNNNNDNYEPEEELWYELKDEDGSIYYFNSGTGISTWYPPMWIDEVDPVSGSVFYVNSKTHEPQWEKPDDFIPVIRENPYATSEETDFMKSVLSPKRSQGAKSFRRAMEEMKVAEEEEDDAGVAP